MAKGPTLTVTLMTDDKMSSGLSSASASVEGFGKKVSGFAIGAGAAITSMAITAIPQVIDLAGQMVGLGQQAELYQTKAKTVFGSNAGDIRKWADQVNESFGLSDEKVIGLAASFGDLMVPLGFTREQAAKMSQETIGLAGALSAWSGGQYDAAEVSDILAKAMLGETDGLKALGISISAAEVDQRAMELAMRDGRDEVTEMDKALASQQLIMEKSADAQAAWADGSMDAVKSQNEMKSAIEEAKTSIGTSLLPMVQSATKWIVENFIPAVRDLVATFQEKWPEIKAAIEPTLIWIQETVAAVIEFVQVAWDQFGERILERARFTWDYIREAIESTMQIIKGVIDLFTGIISGDWGKAWDGIKAIVGGVWDGITNLIRFALQTIGQILDIAWENIKGAASAMWGALAAYIDDTWEKIKSGVRTGIDAIVEFVKGLPGRVASAVGDGFSSLWEKFKGVVNKIIGAWNDLSFKFPQWDADWNGPLPGGGFTVGGWEVNSPNIPTLAAGGIIPATPGGRLAILGEGGQDEAVIPLNKLGGMGGNTYNITVAGLTGPQVADELVNKIKEYERRNGGLPW